jgi:hypothetical protein
VFLVVHDQIKQLLIGQLGVFKKKFIKEKPRPKYAPAQGGI